MSGGGGGWGVQYPGEATTAGLVIQTAWGCPTEAQQLEVVFLYASFQK